MTERTNPYQSPDDRLQVCRLADARRIAPTTGIALLGISVVLLLMAVTLSFMQKKWEGQVGIGVATRIPTAEVAGDIDKAEVAQVIGVSTASLAIVTWGWAFYRRESKLALHLSVLTLLIVFLLMQLLIV